MSSAFRKLTDDLFAYISHDDLASEIKCSVPTIRQARMDETTKGHRAPPPGWEKAALKLAERQAAHFAKLVTRLRASG